MCLVFLRGDSDACEASQADPGETYDPLGLTDEPDTFAKLKDIKNKISRLAMFFSLCYYKQAIVISEGGVENPQHQWSVSFPAGYPCGSADCLWSCVSQLGFMAQRPELNTWLGNITLCCWYRVSKPALLRFRWSLQYFVFS